MEKETPHLPELALLDPVFVILVACAALMNQHAGGHPGQCCHIDFFGSFELLRNMTAVDMGNFMAQQSGQFFFFQIQRV